MIHSSGDNPQCDGTRTFDEKKKINSVHNSIAGHNGVKLTVRGTEPLPESVDNVKASYCNVSYVPKA
jgi:hypothetical protein